MGQLEEYGEVVNIRGSEAYIKFTRTSACGRCQACGMLSTQNEITIHVPNELGASVGDMVAVSIRAKKALGASALAYLFPLLMLILGVFVGWLLASVWNVFSNADTAMALLGLGFVLVSFLLLKFAAPLYNKRVSNVYRMVGRR
jgi:sigma-E factor negative regulatory protein RseC